MKAKVKAAAKWIGLIVGEIAISPFYAMGWLVGWCVRAVKLGQAAIINGYRKGSTL